MVYMCHVAVMRCYGGILKWFVLSCVSSVQFLTHKSLKKPSAKAFKIEINEQLHTKDGMLELHHTH